MEKVMTSHSKNFPHVVHFNVPRDYFETNSRHQKIRGCRGLYLLEREVWDGGREGAHGKIFVDRW